MKNNISQTTVRFCRTKTLKGHLMAGFILCSLDGCSPHRHTWWKPDTYPCENLIGLSAPESSRTYKVCSKVISVPQSAFWNSLHPMWISNVWWLMELSPICRSDNPDWAHTFKKEPCDAVSVLSYCTLGQVILVWWRWSSLCSAHTLRSYLVYSERTDENRHMHTQTFLNKNMQFWSWETFANVLVYLV